MSMDNIALINELLDSLIRTLKENEYPKTIIFVFYTLKQRLNELANTISSENLDDARALMREVDELLKSIPFKELSKDEKLQSPLTELSIAFELLLSNLTKSIKQIVSKKQLQNLEKYHMDQELKIKNRFYVQSFLVVLIISGYLLFQLLTYIITIYDAFIGLLVFIIGIGGAFVSYKLRLNALSHDYYTRKYTLSRWLGNAEKNRK